ncbi:MAG: hypothetical protein K8R40_08215 [Anaerolineaceae bacterium]|nr:hypothetical protein [Anaerolineaceae bacterium]
MKNKLKYFSLITVSALLIFAGVMYQRASAQGISLSELLFPPSSSETTVIEDVSTSKHDLQTLPLEQNSTSNDIQPQEINNDVIAYAKTLIEKADQTYLTPGWLHISGQKEAFITASDTLPDGTPIPTSSFNNNWALIDADGNVTKAVSIDDTGDTFTSQTTVFQDGLWTHLTIPEMSTQEKEIYQITTLDNGFLAAAARMKEPLEIEKEEIELNNEKVVVFSLVEYFPSPTTFGKSSSLVVAGIYSKYYFSVDSGSVRMVEAYHVYPSGEIELWHRITNINIENVDSPPEEISSYFTE